MPVSVINRPAAGVQFGFVQPIAYGIEQNANNSATTAMGIAFPPIITTMGTSGRVLGEVLRVSFSSQIVDADDGYVRLVGAVTSDTDVDDEAHTGFRCVALEATPANGITRVQLQGVCAVNIEGTVTANQWLKVSTAAGHYAGVVDEDNAEIWGWAVAGGTDTLVNCVVFPAPIFVNRDITAS